MDDKEVLKKKMKSESIGSQILNIYSKPIELSVDDSYDLLEKDLIKNIEYCAEHALQEAPCEADPNYNPDNHAQCAGKEKMKGDFYVVNSTIIDPVLRLIRSRFYAQAACPTPTYNQILYKYNAAKGSLEYIWAIPQKSTVDFYCNIYHVEKSALPEKLIPIAHECLRFRSGEYDKLALTLNKESGPNDKHLSPEKVTAIIDNMIKEKEDIN